MKKPGRIVKFSSLILMILFFLTACQDVTSKTAKSDNLSASKSAAASGFEVTTINGKTLSLESLRGKVVLLNFWATWCSPCVKELPHLQRFYEKYKDRGLIVLGLNVENNRELKDIKLFADKVGLSFPIAIASAQTLADYRISPIPHSFFIDQDGVIRDEIKGYGPGSEINMENKIVKLLKIQGVK